MLALLVGQLRARGSDPPGTTPMPGGMRLVLVLQGLVMLGVGTPLFVDLHGSASIWPCR